MDTKPVFSIATIFLVLCVFLGCVPKECQEFEGRAWVFELPVTLTPAKDTFQIGDTIVIESRFSFQVRDSVSGEGIELDNYDFFAFIWLSKSDQYQNVGGYEDPVALNELVSANVEYDKVDHSDGSASIVIDSYNYDGSYYNYQFIFRLMTPGTYSLNFGSLLGLLPDSTPNDNPDVEHECSDHRGEINAFYLMNGGNVIENNIELFRNSNAPNATIRKTDHYRRNGGYTFIVAE